MPNICDYSLKVKGSEESVMKFKNIIQAEYNTENGKENPQHFYRVFEAYDDDNYEVEDGVASDIFNGYCAWSVLACMRGSQHAYYTPDNQNNGTCLEDVSRELNLAVEYFSQESGMAFQEHCVIKNGEVLIDDCVNWCEVDIEEISTLTELIEQRANSVLSYFYDELNLAYKIEDLENFKISEDESLKDTLEEFIFTHNENIADVKYLDSKYPDFEKLYGDLECKFNQAKENGESWLGLGGFEYWDFEI